MRKPIAVSGGPGRWRFRREDRARALLTSIDCPVRIGPTTLKNPVMNAAGTYGLGTEFAAYGDLANLGAFVTKSLSLRPWHGNSGQNVIAAAGGMLNSVGLKNPGIHEWIDRYYPDLAAQRATVVVSAWGSVIDDIVEVTRVIEAETDAVAIEVNLSCPNSGNPHVLVSHDPGMVRRYIGAICTSLRRLPVWAKLAPSSPDMVACAAAAAEGGAAAVTLVNTLSAMQVDIARRAPDLSGIFGGMSGPPLHPIALRAIYQVRSALPELPIVGVGGVHDGETALRMLLVGARCVQVGTASFVNPRAPHLVLDDLRWALAKQGTTYDEVIGQAVVSTTPNEFGLRGAGLASPDPPGARRSTIDLPARSLRGSRPSAGQARGERRAPRSSTTEVAEAPQQRSGDAERHSVGRIDEERQPGGRPDGVVGEEDAADGQPDGAGRRIAPN